MKKKLFSTMTFLIIAIAMILPLFTGMNNTVYAEDKSYSINGLNINANILEDGSMDITETFNMRFDGGPFTIVYQDIPLVANQKTGAKVSIDNVQVSQGTQVFTQVQQQNGRPQGKYFVGKTSDSIHIEWYHSSENVDRQFTVKYRVIGAVTSYNDTADLYWQFVGDKWDVPISNINITVNIPKGAEKSQVKVFGHGPVQGDVELLSPETAKWSLDKLPSNSYLEARMLFPVSLVPTNTNVIKENKYDSIMAEEVQAAKKTDMQKKFSLISVAIGILDIIAALVVIVRNYLKYAKRYKVKDLPEYMRELPDELSPAEVNAFFNYDVPNAGAISATVLDLSMKGFVSFTSSGKKKILIHVEEKDTSSLKNYEVYLIEFLRKVEENGGDIKKYVKRRSQDSKLFFDSFKSGVSSILASQYSSFYESNMSSAMKFPLILMGVNVLLLIAGVFYSPVLIVFSIVTMCISILGFAFSKRKSKEGVKHQELWRSFKRFLKNFSNLDKAELPQIEIWEHYLVYAVALGVAKETIKELNVAYPNMDSNYYGSWYNGYFAAYYYGAGIRSMEGGLMDMNGFFGDIQNTFTEAYTAFTSASTGAGGGFSGGGGFGGGGGGGGAN